MVNKGFLFCLPFLLIVFVSAGDFSIKVINQTSGTLTIQATFPEPQETMVPDEKSADDKSYLFMEGLPLLQQQGYAVIPYATKMFTLAGERVTYKIKTINTKRKNIGNYIIIGLENDLTSITKNVQLKNKNPIEISYHGLFRDLPIFTLNIFPINIDLAQRQAEWIQSITLEIALSSLETFQPKMIRSIAPREKSMLKQLLLNGDAANSKMSGTLSKITATMQRYKSGRYKILTDQTGLYQITYDDLLDYEVPVDQFDTRKIRITNRGQEIPLYFKGGEDGIFDPGDYFEFWVEETRSPFGDKYPDVYNHPFSDINIYWLELSDKNGLRMVEESGALIQTDPRRYLTPYAFTQKIHFEQDNQFVRFGGRGANVDSAGYTMDYWFYDRGVSAIGSRSYEAFLPHPYADGSRSVYVKAMMRGLSDSSKVNPLRNHQVDLWLNDEKVTTSGIWKAQQLHLLTNIGQVGVSQASINHETNQLRVVMDQAGVTDIAILNWFEITYQRKYRAHENFIKFKKQESMPGGFVVQFEIDGFNNSDIELYKLGISKLVNNRIDYITAVDNVSSYRISFQDEIFYPDIEYVALSPEAKKKPIKIVADQPWQPEVPDASLLDHTNRAEYLIVTHELFYENALQLKAYREQAGIEIEVVKVEDIYDEFNYGIKSPLAIKKMLRYAYYNWDQNNPLLYVTLIGSASFNYKGASDYVPTFLFETIKYGAAGSDFQYSLIAGDDTTPDLVIARIPVKNNTDFQAYFDKLLGYESADNIGEWRNTGLFISGNDATTRELFTNQPAFRIQNQRLINMNLPPGFFARKINTVRDQSLQYDPNFGSTTDLINYFDDGVALINFYGHGGGGIWADVQLFNTEDVDRLNNGFQLPFITSMTCFTGAYESSSINGIAEKLVLVPEKGAIGIVAASGLGWLHNDFALGWNLMEFIYQPGLTVGAATLYTKLFYLNNNLYITEDFNTTIPSYFDLKNSMVNHYNLLGEPLVSINLPSNRLHITVDNKLPNIGDTVHVTIEAPFSSASGRIELTNQNHEPIEETFLVFTDFTASTSFNISEELADQRIFLKAYAASEFGNEDARGTAQLAVNKAILDSVVVTPPDAEVGDKVYFSVYVTSPLNIESVRIQNLRGDQGRIYSLGLEQIADTLWKTQQGFGPYNHSDTIYFDVQIKDSSGATYLSRLHYFTIHDPRPDVKIIAGSFKFSGIADVNLTLQIKNDSQEQMSQIELAFYNDSYSGSSIPFTSQSIDLEPKETKRIDVVVNSSLLFPNREFIAVLDGSNNFSERDEQNNIASIWYRNDIFNIPFEIGTTSDGITNDTLSLGSIGQINLPPQGLSASSVLSYKILTEYHLFDYNTQPGFTYVNFKGIGDSIKIKLELHNKSAKNLKNFYLEFELDTSKYSLAYLDAVSICQYLPNLERWVAVNSTRVGDKISAQVNSLGEFALFHSQDNEEPKIEITINGRNLHQNMLVPESPHLALILQDDNGVNLSNGFQILIDNDSLARDEINMPDSLPNANAVSILATPKLSAGAHNLTIQVQDTQGNTAIKSIDFMVADGFEMQVYGNYPNPFDDLTIISFQVIANGILENFAIKIYTVSGRLIREIKYNEEYPDEIWDPGYHEVEWDGRDQDGNIVANGVYFAVINAKYRGETVEHTLKMAKLR